MNENQEVAGRVSSTAVGFIIGAAVGAGIALLLAPASGEVTRRRLGETAKRWGSHVRDGVETAGHRLKENVGGLKSDVQAAVSSGRDAFRRERQSRLEQNSRLEQASP